MYIQYSLKIKIKYIKIIKKNSFFFFFGSKSNLINNNNDVGYKDNNIYSYIFRYRIMIFFIVLKRGSLFRFSQYLLAFVRRREENKHNFQILV